MTGRGHVRIFARILSKNGEIVTRGTTSLTFIWNSAPRMGYQWHQLCCVGPRNSLSAFLDCGL
jgi:hypothetical protein